MGRSMLHGDRRLTHVVDVARRGWRRARASHVLRHSRRGAVLVAAAACVLSVAAPPAGAAQYHRYFGDLHTHTSDSDGEGTPAQAFAAAKAAGADYLVVTDHAGRFGPERWSSQLAAADAATGPRFIALNGYEVTMAWGHVNVYGTVTTPSEAELVAMNRATPLALYDWLAVHPGSIAQWNHPTWKSRDFAGYVGCTSERLPIMGAIEVLNDRYFYEQSYTRALDRGWRVMPTANSDTHDADWVIGRPQRTVLLAEELSRPALLGALRARRGYATSVSDLAVAFSGNGRVMGSTLQGPATIRFTVRVTDPKPHRKGDALRAVALVADGGEVVAKRSCRGRAVKWTPTVVVRAAVAGGAHYFFLRVGTASGWVAWTAPIWIGGDEAAADPT